MFLKHSIQSLAFILHEFECLGSFGPIDSAGISLSVALLGDLSRAEVKCFSLKLLLKQSVLGVLIQSVLGCLGLRLHLNLVLHQSYDVLDVLRLLLHVDLLNHV